ncbi:ABC transporter permease [Saccharothrix algeriensis]|uniref:ABC transporter permease n=1 Tax=Saccharothrix algeriensis TaxID=173560 RepID=A0A8T8I4V3_9PSEU|nr:ABC transporter permease [Saccharothrix algeriensis]MBM7811657.1 ABC-2 type transport system permease protein [Saccharothrix algeriensis]QTR05440.1 ABC transporter permease [Saccharothrix algeriensis]
MSTLTPGRAVFLVARREFLAKVRTRSFLWGTLVVVAVLAGYVLLQTALFDRSGRDAVALSGQATVLAQPLEQTARSFGREVDVVDVTDVAAAEEQVRAGELDALVTGAPDALRVVVKDRLDDGLRNSIDLIVKQQVLNAQLAEADLDPEVVARNVEAAKVDVVALDPEDSQRGQRLAIGLVIAVLLYYSLLVYGTMVAQGVVEEKSSRVVEILLATLRPWQLLLGKVIGLGLVGLVQLVLIGGIGLVLSSVSGVIDVTGVAGGALATGVLWYLLGFFLYATIFAAAASLVSRQEELQSVLTPISMAIVIAFVVGINLMIQDASDTLVAVLSVLPPFAPILMPGRMAMGVAPTWQVLLAIVLAIGTAAAITWLGGKVYSNAVLKTGARVKLRDALR